MGSLALAVMLLAQMTPSPSTAVITGQVRGFDGSPAAAVQVFVLSVTAEGPARKLEALSRIAETDATGHYRLEGILPGRYVVAAGLLEAPTYYPGVNSLGAAGEILVTAGKTFQNIDFALEQSAGVRVSGRVRGLPKGTPAGLMRAALTPRSAAAAASVDGAVQSDGSFEFLRIPRGNYILRLTPSLTPTTLIEVRNQDVGPLEFNIGPALLGRVEIEGGGSLPTPVNASPGVPNLSPLVRIEARRTNTSTALQLRPDGIFLLLLPAGEYNVAVTQLPFGLSVKSISSGAVNLLRMPLKIDRPPAIAAADIAVILTSLSGEAAGVRVAGRVIDLPGAPSSNELWVRLESYERRPPNRANPFQQRIGETRVQPDGSFEFLRVPPGDYRAIVFTRGAQNIGTLTGLGIGAINVGGIELTTTGAPRPTALQARLESLGGSTAKDCGHASLAQLRSGAVAPDTVVKCVEDAIQSSTAFLVSVQQQGIDSIVMLGIAARPQGGIVSVVSDGGSVSGQRACVAPKLTINIVVGGMLRCD